MKKILKIARVELSVLFYSPVAWLMLAIFMVQCGVVFYDALLGIRNAVSMGYDVGAITPNLLGTRPGGLARIIIDSLFMYMPILTMGLMSRETSSGSIKLLLSSPVKVHQIILGKYLAIIGFGLGFVAIVACYDLMGLYVIKNADSGLFFAQLLGIYLLICAYAAIGLFMSCLTSYQIVAFISTIAVFAVMRYVGGIWQDIDFVRDLTYFLSISGRPEKMGFGLITSKDLFYFLIIIASFLLLCGFKLKSAMESKPWSVHVARHVLLICCALGLGYVTSRPSLIGYLDMTERQTMTIAAVSQQIAGRFDDGLKITAYTNALAPYSWPLFPMSRNMDLDKWEGYQRFIPGLQTSYAYYYQKPVDPAFDDFKADGNKERPLTDVHAIAKRAFENMDVDGRPFMSPAQMEQLIDLRPEGYLSVRRLEYQGSGAFLRFSLQEPDPDPSEMEINAALKRLIVKAPSVVFLTGNARGTATKADRDYQLAGVRQVRRLALINQGFDVSTVDLAHQEIPADASIVVLGDPTAALTAAEQAKVEAYLHDGGNMLIMGEPGRQQVLNPILKVLGVQLKEGILVFPDRDVTPGFLSARLLPSAASLDPFMNLIVARGAPVATQGASAVEYSAVAGYSIKPLLLTPPGSRIEQAGIKRSPLTGDIDVGAMNIRAGSVPGAEKGLFVGTYPIAVSMTRSLDGRQQRVIVSGDADFMSNGELDRSRGMNTQYMHGIFRWLSNGEFPVYTPRLPPRDTDLLVSREVIKVWMWIGKAGLPALLLIVGAIILFRRRAQ